MGRPAHRAGKRPILAVAPWQWLRDPALPAAVLAVATYAEDYLLTGLLRLGCSIGRADHAAGNTGGQRRNGGW